eukprot:6209228-Pleurochrysis_carterae.AAC.1
MTARELGVVPVFAAIGATATASLLSRSAARATEGRGARAEERTPLGRESPNMRSPEAWTRKRIAETHATQKNRTTGTTGGRKSEAAMTGLRHAALHATQRSNGELGRVGQKSDVGTAVPSTAS